MSPLINYRLADRQGCAPRSDSGYRHSFVNQASMSFEFAAPVSFGTKGSMTG